jgi:hypothetical protein
MKRTSHKLGFIATMAAMAQSVVGIGKEKYLDESQITDNPHIPEYNGTYYGNHQPAFIPSRSTVIRNKRRAIHNNRVKAK